MHIYFMSFWWMIFPAMWAVSALLKSWMRDQRQRDAMAVAREFMAQGKPVPPEISRILAEDLARAF